MAYRVAALPGDGIGIEVLAEGLRVLHAVAEPLGLTFEIDEIPCGGKFYLEHGTRDWPEGAEERVAAADVVFLGAVGWPDPDKDGPQAEERQGPPKSFQLSEVKQEDLEDGQQEYNQRTVTQTLLFPPQANRQERHGIGQPGDGIGVGFRIARFLAAQ